MGHTSTIAQWVRLSGTEDEQKAFDYIASVLKDYGYEVQQYYSDALIGYPQEASLTVLGDTEVKIDTNGYSYSPATDESGITAEVVYAGNGFPADYQGVDARGKIVLSDGLANPVKAHAAEEAGAAGQIHINNERIHEMCISPVWGTPTPETAGLLPGVPAIAITEPDGDTLKARLSEGALRVRFTTKPFFEWGKIPTLTADLPGVEEDRYVLFSGHVDSWHYGAMDNGTANSTQLEVARILAENRDQLRRGVKLAFWSGHSHCRYAGSAWFADEYWHDIHDRCICHVNVDSVGGIGANLLSKAPTMAETYGFAKKVFSEVLNADLDYVRMARFSDQSFWGHGVPSLFATFSQQGEMDGSTSQSSRSGRGIGLGWWWHTTEDTVDKIDPDNLVRDAHVYAETLWRLCTSPDIPFDFAEAADEMADTLKQYHEAANGHFDLARTEQLARELSGSIRVALTGMQNAEPANDLKMELSRALVPVNYTQSGPFHQDLAMGTSPLPGLSLVKEIAQIPEGDADYYYAKTKLVRERNRIEHALRSSLKLVNDYCDSATRN